MTNGLGRKDSIVFSISDIRAGSSLNFDPHKSIQFNEDLLLSAFDLKNKNNGFWKVRNGITSLNPVRLCMDSFYYNSRVEGDRPESFTPIKARHAEKYLIERQSAREFPNLYITSDFKVYDAVSDIHPERAWNWLTSELVTWRMPDGDLSQGILYKPEDFDPHKRYPVIFHYYVRQSNELNGYKRPDWSLAGIDIPYFVSNGYLVFMPDIYYKLGRNGESVVNSVVSAARYLSRFPFIDSTKMGIQGHSFAGWETDYLVTHSHIFAAACAAAGVSDQISNFNELANGSLFPASYLEIANPGHPYGPGVTPFTEPELYEENSPVLGVGNASTPLLLIAGDHDGSTPLGQDLEMYLAMRRAGKKVWLLEYKKGGHTLLGNDGKDFTIRMKQFFDYYLKGNPPPVWMTRGVPASLKGIDTGFEIDTSGAKP
jgi:dipeptidyl aminopeptidase/acylaminoacyl peptidase